MEVTWWGVSDCTCCSRGSRISGQRSKMLVSWAEGSCRRTLYDWGLVLWQHFTKPSHTFGYFHTCGGLVVGEAQHGCYRDQEHLGWGLTPTCFMMRRDRMFMTKPPSRGYMVRDWMTVRMSSMGSGFWSISCCITTANTSDVYTFFSPKQRLVAGVKNRVRMNQKPLFEHLIITVTFDCTKHL